MNQLFTTAISNRSATVIISNTGAQVKSYRIGEENEILFPQRLFRKRSEGGIYPLFPFVARPRQANCFSATSLNCCLHNQLFALVAKTKTQAIFEFQNKSTHTFPWLLKFHVIVSLPSEACLLVWLMIERLSDGIRELAPVNAGFVPFFKRHELSEVVVGNHTYTDFPAAPQEIPFFDRVTIRNLKQELLMVAHGGFDGHSALSLCGNPDEGYFCVKPRSREAGRFADPEKGMFLDKCQKASFEIACVPV